MPRWMLLALLVGSVALLAAVAWPREAHLAGPPTVGEVASELICQCGCESMLVSECACDFARKMKSEIQGLIDDGKTKGEILDYFVSVYGEGVLATPKKSGFGLTAWLLPILAVGGGGGVVAWLLWAWVKRRPVEGMEPATTEKGSLTPYEEQVERDLELME